MEEEWAVLKNDCLLYSTSAEDFFQLTPLHGRLTPVLFSSASANVGSLTMLEHDSGPVKLEPDDTSDYHGSSSASPSSSLCSTSMADLGELGIIHYGPAITATGHASAMGGLVCSTSAASLMPSPLSHPLTSPLPPVSHFSLCSPSLDSSFSPCEQQLSPINMGSGSGGGQHGGGGQYQESGSALSRAAINAARHARSKMHEMALQHRLISDQDPRGCGSVQLSAEERRTLQAEGYSLPTQLPLTKAQEEALKIVRRKIKNKLSAQESRRKRKEYMDSLEHKIQQLVSENNHLKRRVKELEAVSAKSMRY